MLAEGDARGVRLVAVDEHGDRQLELLEPAAERARDSHPAISPDGRWLAFASSRGRAEGETCLWIAPLAADARPIRLTDATGIDTQPAWSGSDLVWARAPGGHGFDLWRARIDTTGAAPRLIDARALTGEPGYEVTPSIAPGGAVVYAAVTDLGGGHLASRLEERTPAGAVRVVTEGPNDSAPAVSPDGLQVAFARPVARAGGLVDSDLWLVPRAGGEARLLVELPLTDESGPVWSRDGRYVLATSVLRGADGRARFSSVIVIDTRESQPVARILEDRAGPIARLTPALAPLALDDAALRADPEYLPELARILAGPMVEAKQAGAGSAP